MVIVRYRPQIKVGKQKYSGFRENYSYGSKTEAKKFLARMKRVRKKAGYKNVKGRILTTRIK